MFHQDSLPWPLIVATAFVTLFLMASLPLAEAGFDMANSLFARPLEDVMRQIW